MIWIDSKYSHGHILNRDDCDDIYTLHTDIYFIGNKKNEFKISWDFDLNKEISI